MKKLIKTLFIFSCALNVYALEPVWIFNNGSDVGRVSIGQGQLYSEAGRTRIIPTGTDLTMTLPVRNESAFSADERPFFGVRYKYRTSQKIAGLFFTTDKMLSLSKGYSKFSIIGDNTWRTAIGDMRKFKHGNWKNKITSVRFDPVNPSTTSDVCEISRLGFFASEEQAQKFLDAAEDAPDYSQPTKFKESLQEILVPGGSLFDGFDCTDFMLQSTTIENPSLKTVVKFQPKKTEADSKACVIVRSHTNSRGFTRFMARKPGLYTLENVDLKLDDISDLHKREREAIEFTVARQLLKAADEHNFRPLDPVSDADWQRAVELLFEADIDLRKLPKPASRSAAAVALSIAIRKTLGTSIDSPYEKEYFTRDRIRTGASVNLRTDAIGDDFIKTFSSAGFDWIIASGSLTGPYRRTLLRDCALYGVEVIMGDGGYNNVAVSTAEYFDHPCFAGTYVTDEPGTDQYEKLAEICKAYIRDTGGKLPYINLLPMYANAAQLKFGANAAAIEYYDPDPDLYKKHCDLFCEMFPVSYICTDIYPLNWVNGRRNTYKNYCESINVIATSAREHGKDFWCHIQTFAWVKSKRTPTESEFRWQSYCMLSFGCKTLICWTYAGRKPEFPSLVSIDGRRSNAWYDAATVFKEIRHISDAFVSYRNIGAMSHNCTEATPYLRFSNPVEKFAAIETIDCEQPLLIGCFTAKEGQGKAFTLVNMSELEAVETAQVKLRLSGSKVIAWPRGRQVTLTAESDGMHHLTLAPGEGIFVEIK